MKKKKWKGPYPRVIAFDMGSSSGRAVLGELKDERLTYREIYRFDNIPIEKDGHLRWNFPVLMKEIRHAAGLAGEVDGLAFATWGADYGVIGKDGTLMEYPRNYRDGSQFDSISWIRERITSEEAYSLTGCTCMPGNSIYQLIAQKQEDEIQFEKIDKILFMPDLFAYSLTGNAYCELSVAATGEIINPVDRDLSFEILHAAGIDADKFSPRVTGGFISGEYQGIPVITTLGHDTQCAILAMTEDYETTAFISCGSWSIIGCRSEKPVISETGNRFGFSNEVTLAGKTDVVRNIVGMWLIQECRREWKKQGRAYSYADLERIAWEADGFVRFIDPDADLFYARGDMVDRIRTYCRITGQTIPETDAEVIRCIYDSLAMKYRQNLNRLEDLTGRSFSRIQIMSGGCQAQILCRLTADACGRDVYAGPVEATSLGNIISQLAVIGAISDVEEGRRLIRASEAIRRYKPSGRILDDAYERFCKSTAFYTKVII